MEWLGNNTFPFHEFYYLSNIFICCFMKLKSLLTVVSIATTVFLSSCVEDEVVGNDFSRSQKITGEITDPDEDLQGRSCVDVKNATSTYTPFLWQPNDKIGVYTENGSSGNVPFTNTSKQNVSTTEFSGQISGTPYYAYYPYSSANDGRDVTNLQGTILAEQPYNLNTHTLVSDYKYGLYQAGTNNKFKFKQLFTLLCITVNATGTDLQDERLNNVTFKVTDSNGNERPISGDFTFSAVDGDWEAEGNTSGTVNMPWTTRPTLKKNKTYTGYINIMPVVKEGDNLSIEVYSEGHMASFTASIKTDFQAGKFYSIPLKLKDYKNNSSKYNYVEVEIDRPTFNNFDFKVEKNVGKLLDNKLEWNSTKHTPSFQTVTTYSANVDNDNNVINLTIPYLYDFMLKPSFTVSSDDCKVLVNGVNQESEITEVDFYSPVTYSIISKSGGSRDYTVNITNTGLPIVVVEQSKSGNFSKVYKNTLEQIFGGTPYNEFVDFMIRGKDTDWVDDDHITIYNADGSLDCEVDGGVRLRGNTSQEYPKKPFAMKFNSKKSVLGMPEHKRWVLLANWLDHSMIRNTVAFDIAHYIEMAWSMTGGIIEPGIPWNVHGQNVELVIVENGQAHHVGNYFLCEQIKIDSGRLNISKPYEDGGNGYLFEVDNNYDETYKFKTSNGVPFMFKDDVTNDIVSKVQTKVQAIEDNIDAGNFSAAYENLDINTMVDQFLIWELTLNREYGDPRSVYMYMDGDGKLSAGPVWDFDRGTFQNQENAKSYGNTDRVKPDNEWMCWRNTSDDNYIWYKQLIKDPIFQAKVQERWAVIKQVLEYFIPEQIRMYGETQKVSYSFDSAMWPTKKADVQAWKSGFKDWSGDEQIDSYDDVINNFVTVFNERLAGMDYLITSGKFTK